MRSLALVALLVACLPAAALADWPSDPSQNLPVCQATGTQTDHVAVSDGVSGTIVFWNDSRAGDPGLYGQRVDANAGEHWAADGAMVASITSYWTLDAACPDGSGGAFVSWYVGTQVHVLHVDSGGQATWSPSGTVVGTGATYDSDTGLVSDGAGGVIVAWRSSESGGASYAVRGQRLDQNGVAQWDPTGVVLGAVSTDYPWTPLVLPDGSGGVVVVWAQSDPSVTSWKIVAQHAGPSGALLGTAGGHQLRIGAFSRNQSLYGNELWLAAAVDGAHGAYVTWTERDVAGTSRLFAQRLGSSGTALWPEPGTLLASSTFATPAELQICVSGTSSAIAAWKQSEQTTGIALRAQRLDADGTPLWTQGGVAVCHPTSVSYPCCPGPTGDLSYVHAASDGLGGALFAYSEYKFLGPPSWDFEVNIKGARVTQSGQAPWSDTGTPICTAAGRQYEPTLLADGSGGAVVTWEDDRPGSSQTDVYAQNLHGDGTIGGVFVAAPPAVPGSWARAWPSPARGRVQLAFTSSGGAADVVVLDLAGRSVRELLRGPVPAGETRVEWDGFGADGRRVPPGLYAARIVVATRQTMLRIPLVR